MHKHIIVRQLIYSYKTLALFLSRSLQSKECLNKPNLLQRKLGKFARNIRMSFRQLLPATCDATFATCYSNATKSFFVESHRKSKQHQRKLETKIKSQSKQTFPQLHQVNFKEQVVSSFLAADIPLQKLNHPSLKSLFATIRKVLPSETAARACVAKLASQKEEQIQELLRNKNIF